MRFKPVYTLASMASCLSMYCLILAVVHWNEHGNPVAVAFGAFCLMLATGMSWIAVSFQRGEG